VHERSLPLLLTEQVPLRLPPARCPPAAIIAQGNRTTALPWRAFKIGRESTSQGFMEMKVAALLAMAVEMNWLP